MLARRGLGADRPLRTTWCRQLCAQAAEATRPRPYREHVLPFKGAVPRLLGSIAVLSACLRLLK